jgi:hypothetical protein
MILGSDGTADTLALAYREVLVHCGSSLDCGGVGTSGLIYVINTVVRGNLFGISTTDTDDLNILMSYSAQVVSSTAGVVSAVGLDNMVLKKRSSESTVQGDRAVATRIDGAGVVNGAT